MKKTYELFDGKDLEVAELILRRRMQMLVHSYLYYDKDTNIISDRQFDEWGRELVKLQANYPNIANQVDYADAFADWDASTGFNLPRNEQVQRIGNRLLSADSTKTIKPRQPVLSKSVTKPKTKAVRKSLF